MTEPTNQKDHQGLRHGLWEWHLLSYKFRVYYIHGKEHGDYEKYYSDDTLESKGHLVYGVLHGVREWYYPNGTLRRRGHYRHGKISGLWIWLRKNRSILDKRYNIRIK